jgi:hypothetical protein
LDTRFALPENTVVAGDYRIVRVVGAGGFGITYEAEDRSLGTTVALKEYYPADFGDRDGGLSVRPKSERHKGTFDWGRSNFLAEARTLARFEHESIVRVTRVFEANATAYMVMRFERGQSFEHWVRGLKRPPTQDEMDSIASPLLDALEIMHRANFLHRDIAPDNVIVRPDGTPVLLDFGAARRAVAEMSRALTGIVKAGYSPHEQYSSDGRLQGPWSDIYALGGTLYRAVCGRRPEEATLRLDVDRMPTAGQLAEKGRFRPGFLAAIDACLKVKYTERPQSVAQVRPLLLAPEPSVRRAGGSRRYWPAIAAGILLVAGGAYGGYEFTRWTPKQGTSEGARVVEAPPSVPLFQQADLDVDNRLKVAAEAAERLARVATERRRLEAEAAARADAERRREEERAAAEEARRQAEFAAEARSRADEMQRIAARDEAAVRADDARRQAEAAAGRASDLDALTRSLRIALTKVGCISEKAEGPWSAKDREALARFARVSRLDLKTDEPSMPALEAVVAKSGRVCVVECEADRIERDGKCVPRSAPAKKPVITKAQSSEKNAEERRPATPNKPAERNPGSIQNCLNQCDAAGGRNSSPARCNRKCGA